MHEFHVFWQWLAQSLGHRLSTAIGHQPATNLGFDFFFELLDSAFVFVFGEALFEIGCFTLI